MSFNIISAQPFLQHEAIGAIRFITGVFMVYHGMEVFYPETMQQYLEWDIFKNANGGLMVYAGKSAELLSGLLLMLGLFTRLGCIILFCTMLYVSFVVGNGKVWYDAQHPFMFVLMAVLFFFTGPGRWSLDAVFKKH